MNKRTGVGSLVTVTESHSSEHTRAVCTCRTRRHLGPVPTQVTGSWTFGSRVCGGLTGTSVWRNPKERVVGPHLVTVPPKPEPDHDHDRKGRVAES